MKVVTEDFIKGKKVLLRYDIDVALSDVGDQISEIRVVEDFKLKAGLETLRLCLENASKVIVIGHIGRPDGTVVEELRVAPIIEWFSQQDNLRSHIRSGKLVVLENLRFDPREEGLDMGFAKNLAQMGEVYINEAFAAYRPAVSTTILPTILPSAVGLRFAQEVEKLTQVRDNPKKPFVVIMGGAKVADKLPVINALAQKADAVLVGGKLVQELNAGSVSSQPHLPKNVYLGNLTEDGFDIDRNTLIAWKEHIMTAKMIVWNGPVGKFEDPKNEQSAKLAQVILNSGAETIVGGGDTLSLLDKLDILDQFEGKGFVSTGGGAMLKFLSEGTLPTVEALNGHINN